MKAALGDSPLYLAASHTYRGDDRARIAALNRSRGALRDPAHRHRRRALSRAPPPRAAGRALSCVREGTTIAAAGFKLEANAERHLKRASEMARLFKGHEAALARTLEIAEACTFSLDELVYEYPDEPTPAGKSPQAHLEDLTWEGARWRFPDGIPDKVRAIIERELQLIAELNYAPYFLTVHDIVHFARSQDILCQGRGSAANSAVCYCLAITAVNPTEIDLLVRALRLARAQGAARHRRRFRARAARGGDPVHLRPLRPRPRRHRGDRHLLSHALGGARRRQGDGAVGGYGRRARRHGVGDRRAAARCPKSTCARRGSIRAIRCSPPCSS